MIKRALVYGSILAVAIIFLSVTVLAASPPTVETRSATLVVKNAAMLNGAVTSTGGAAIDERRFSWGTTSSCSDGYTNQVSVSGSYFAYDLMSLTPGKTYYFQAWAHNSAGWGKGNVLSFTTAVNRPPNTPSMPSGYSSGKTGTSYSYSTSATDPDGDQVKYTFRWDDNTPDTPTGFVASGISQSAYHTWSAPATYYVQAMATDSYGASSSWSASKVVNICKDQCTSGTKQCSGSGYQTCGDFNSDGCTEWSSVTNCPTGQSCSNGQCVSTLPTVETRSATLVVQTAAMLNGVVTSDGGAAIDERRFYWGTTSSCSDGYTNQVSVSGSNFAYDLMSLTPGKTYYFRAEAHNSAGWGRGNVLSFTTPSQVCTPGSKRCNGGNVETCNSNGGGWTVTQACGSGQTCSNGQCVPICTSQCTSGAKQCSGSGIQTCGDFNSDGCTEWSSVTNCPAGQSCSNGQCVPACTNQCALGTKQCSGSGIQTCGDFNSDGCTEWSSVTNCPSGQSCSNGQCMMTASLGGRVWNDANYNGLQDSSETAISDIAVKLYASGGTNPISTTTTDYNGRYSFGSLTPGDYLAEFTLPSGYVFSPNDQGGDDTKDSDVSRSTGRTTTIHLESGQSDMKWDAGIYPVSADPYNNIIFKEIDLIPKDKNYLIFNKEAVLMINMKNIGMTVVQEADWNIELQFWDIYSKGIDDILTAVLKKDQMDQQRTLTLHFNKLYPGESQIISYPIKLEYINKLQDNYLGFADQLRLRGSPAPLPIDYSNNKHYGLKDNLYISADYICPGGECAWSIFKIWLNFKTKLLSSALELDPELGPRLIGASVDLQILPTNLMVNGLCDASTPKMMGDLIYDSTILGAKLVKGLNPYAEVFDLVKEICDSFVSCAIFINEMIAETTRYFNENAIKVIFIHINHGTDVNITNPSGERMSIIDGNITNGILNSSAFFVSDGEMIMIGGQDTLNIQIKGTNTSTMEIACAVPVGDNQSLYNQYEIPVVQGTELTTTYINASGIEPIKVDTQADGTIDQIAYPQVVKYADQVVEISAIMNATPSIGTPGSDVVFTINITNIGNVTLNSVRVIDYLPVGLSYMSDSRSGTISGRNITWDMPNPLGNGSSTFIQLVARIDSLASGSLCNLVEATGVGATDISETVSRKASSYIAINTPPSMPSKPAGSTTGMPGTSYSYCTFATDPDDDQITYTFDWGDGTNATTALFDSGDIANATHIWNNSGIYEVKAKATDSNGLDSEWSDAINISIANNSCISGTKFNDTNSNATRDPGEAGLSGWTIRLTRPDGTTINTTTDANGAYKFENLTSGTYRVSEVRQSNWTQTYPAWLGDHIVNITDSNVTGVDFGNNYLPIPEIPFPPSGPASGIPGAEYIYSTSSTDPNGYQISYTFDWGDGTNSTTGLFDSGAVASAAHIWSSSGVYQVRAMATNSKGTSSGWSDSLNVTINAPPSAPAVPVGPTSGSPGTSYAYSTSATDPDGDQIYYTFDWGDGTNSTTGFFDSGAIASASHIWNSSEVYQVRVMATDSWGASSEWFSELEVTIEAGDIPDQIGVFRNGGLYFDANGDGYWTEGDTMGWFGATGDLPVAGDWDGNGKDEIAVFRNGGWYFDANGDGYWTEGDTTGWFGATGDLPAAGDWDGDGRDEIAVFRNGRLYFDADGDGYWSAGDTTGWFGASGDLPAAGDWNGDGRDEIAVFRNGGLYFDADGDGYWSEGDTTGWFGATGDLPAAGDWDGDGKDEIAVFRNGGWYFDADGDGYWTEDDTTGWFGAGGDRPVAGRWGLLSSLALDNDQPQLDLKEMSAEKIHQKRTALEELQEKSEGQVREIKISREASKALV